MHDFDTWIYVIPGFTQTRGTRTRLIELWMRLYKRLSDRGVSVQLQPWKSDWESEAELITRTSSPSPSVYVVAYSWGAGWGFSQLAKELRARGIGIKHAWLIDPVYRHRYLAGQWRALLPWVPIKVPSNVKRVTWWRQKETLPHGHDLKAESEFTEIEPPVWVEGVEHVHMDDFWPITLDIQDELGIAMSGRGIDDGCA